MLIITSRHYISGVYFWFLLNGHTTHRSCYLLTYYLSCLNLLYDCFKNITGGNGMPCMGMDSICAPQC